MSNLTCKEKSSFICPCCRLVNRSNTFSSLFLSSTVSNTLICEACSETYPIIENVPVFCEEISSSQEPNDTAEDGKGCRHKFYYDQYTGRSRKKDLESDYLARERLRLREFAANNDITGTCLEIGCGTGIFADMVPNYIGLDYSLPSLLADGFHEYTRVATSAENIPFPSVSIELIFSFNTLEHIPQPELAFGEIDRLLAPGGYAFLRPAWHCTQYNTKLLPVKRYSELNFVDKTHKFLIPLLKSRPFKLLSRLPMRTARRIFYFLQRVKRPTHLKYRALKPYLGEDYFISDCDATADIDCHEAILWFESREYDIMSHRSSFQKITAGADILIVKKKY